MKVIIILLLAFLSSELSAAEAESTPIRVVGTEVSDVAALKKGAGMWNVINVSDLTGR